MSAKIDMSLLQKIPLFQGMSKAHLRSLLKQTNLEKFPSGKVIVAEGDPGGRMFLILDGLAKVSVKGRNRTTLGPGDFFGEISLLDKGPRSATVTAETSVEALSLTSWNFLSLMQEHWTMNAAVLRSLAQLVRHLDRSPTS